LKVPGEYRDIFPELARAGVLPSDFAQRLVGMAKFRNVLVDMYLAVNPRRVYENVQHDLDDFDVFARHITEFLATHNLEGA
jgi:uncharacterized protein YutE (UPF0331/DUF86 family)